MERQKSFLLVLIVAALGICLAMIYPFLDFILTGLILAFLLIPLKDKFDEFIGSGYSSTLVVVLTVLGAILPLIVAVGFVANDAANLVSSLNQSQSLDLTSLEQQIENLLGADISLEERIRSGLRAAGNLVVSSTSEIVGLTSDLFIGASLMLFVEFYGLKDGRKAVGWTEKFDLMPTDIQEDLYRDTAKTTKAVVKGHLLVALATGLLTGIGLFLTGIPNGAFWTFMSVISGLIPVVGTALIWVPAAVYLVLSGPAASGIALLLYGVVVIGGAENFLRPYLVDEEADLHPLYILLGVVGGIGLFGVIGIFVGPVVFGVTKSLLNIYRENLDRFS